MMGFKSLISATILVSACLGFSPSVYAQTNLEVLARATVSENSSEAERAIAALREQGPSGIEAFLKTYSDKLQLADSQAMNPEWQRLRAALDAICQQRDCYASRLYWYTDLKQAKAAAKASGKPILSLRLLGRLDEELSCANSRFFRIVLYPNTEVSKMLRDRFVLHWESVRPVPQVTINYGDGRTLERTLTGNSIHYILDAEGRPIDALPGLYGPQAFVRKLAQAEQAVKDFSGKTGEEREEFLVQYHRDRIAANQKQWADDLKQLGISMPLAARAVVGQTSPELAEIPSPPTAQEAGRVAFSKMVVEDPIISAISENRERLTNATNDESWAKIAELYRQDASLDLNSQALMRNKNPKLYYVSSNGTTEDPLLPALGNFERAIALDTVRNEYLLHSEIHQLFVQKLATNDVQSLNEWVYSQLFLTPSSDPWLGLFPADTYTGIENDGVRQ